MVAVEYEREFKLTPKQAYEKIAAWLVAIKTDIKDSTEPFYIKAVQGTNLVMLDNPSKRKTLSFDITPLDPKHGGVKVHLKASMTLWRRESRMQHAQESWDEHLFTQLWAILNTTREEDLLWQIKVTQFLIALPKVQKESDFKGFMKKLCQRFQAENLTDDQVQQITEALKLQLLTAKLFAPTKREKLLEVVGSIAKTIFGEVIPAAISGALVGVVEYLVK